MTTRYIVIVNDTIRASYTDIEEALADWEEHCCSRCYVLFFDDMGYNGHCYITEMEDRS